MAECPKCRVTCAPEDRFCRLCGASLQPAPFGFLFRRTPPTPEEAASYWRGFFRPFFMMAFGFFAIFFIAALILIVIWFFMFGRAT